MRSGLCRNSDHKGDGGGGTCFQSVKELKQGLCSFIINSSLLSTGM